MQQVRQHDWKETTVAGVVIGGVDDLRMKVMTTDLGDGYVAHVVKHAGPHVFRVKLYHDDECVLVSCDYARESYEAACRDALMVLRNHVDKQRAVIESQLDRLNGWLYEEV